VRSRWITVVALSLSAACSKGSDPGVVAKKPPPPIEVRPVLEVAPWGSCNPPGKDVLPAVDETECLTVGEALQLAKYTASYERDASDEASGTLTLDLDVDDLASFNRLASVCFARSATCPTARLAIVFHGKVLVGPTVQEPEFGGQIAVYGRDKTLRPVVDEMEHR
jgi:hypothetical protein